MHSSILAIIDFFRMLLKSLSLPEGTFWKHCILFFNYSVPLQGVVKRENLKELIEATDLFFMLWTVLWKLSTTISSCFYLLDRFSAWFFRLTHCLMTSSKLWWTKAFTDLDLSIFLSIGYNPFFINTRL